MARSTAPLSLTLSVSFVASVYAGGGAIPFKPYVKVLQPTQRALIAWDGKEEIMVLTADLAAPETVKVLEVMPLPSEPTVTKASTEVFLNARNLINEKIRALPKPPAGAPPHQIAAEITFNEKIGAHDITVARLTQPEKFAEWVHAFLASNNVANPTIPPIVRRAAEDYIREGYTWFVFDLVELDDNLKTIEAIQYRFRAACLYYPVRISRGDLGSTSVELLILTPGLLREFPGVPVNRIESRYPAFRVTSSEINSLNTDMNDLLGMRKEVSLRVWRLRGDLTTLDKDLLAK